MSLRRRIAFTCAAAVAIAAALGSVVAYFVDRTVEYARHQLEQGRTDDAHGLLEECLFYETSHPGVRQLKAEMAADERQAHPPD